MIFGALNLVIAAFFRISKPFGQGAVHLGFYLKINSYESSSIP